MVIVEIIGSSEGKVFWDMRVGVWRDGLVLAAGGETGLNGQLRVTADGLRALAGRCRALAHQLTSNTAPNGATASDQSSVAAVGICDDRIAVAGAALAAWTSVTAGTLTTSASVYERADTGSASELDAMVR